MSNPQTTASDTLALDVCPDCVVYVMNDDASGAGEDFNPAAVTDAVRELAQDGYPILTTDSEQPELFFSWLSCELCKRPGGGDRVRMTAVAR